MNKKDKTVLFDPGFAPLVIDYIGQTGYSYYTFSAVPDVKLKRLNFPHTLRKLEKLIKINASFYLGCMLWASYIKTFDDYKIEGNMLLGEDAKEEEYTNEISFLVDLVKTQLPKDSKYYLSKPLNMDNRYLTIFETYKDFLIINQGFVNCSKTNQIELPKNLKPLENA